MGTLFYAFDLFLNRLREGGLYRIKSEVFCFFATACSTKKTGDKKEKNGEIKGIFSSSAKKDGSVWISFVFPQKNAVHLRIFVV